MSKVLAILSLLTISTTVYAHESIETGKSTICSIPVVEVHETSPRFDLAKQIEEYTAEGSNTTLCSLGSKIALVVTAHPGKKNQYSFAFLIDQKPAKN